MMLSEADAIYAKQKRFDYAMEILMKTLNSPDVMGASQEQIAAWVFKLADAMIAESNKTP